MARDRPERAIPIDPLPTTQEPYVHIVAPNIDRISRDTFRRGTVAGRRARRGVIVLAVVLLLAAITAVIGIALPAIR